MVLLLNAINLDTYDAFQDVSMPSESVKFSKDFIYSLRLNHSEATCTASYSLVPNGKDVREDTEKSFMLANRRKSTTVLIILRSCDSNVDHGNSELTKPENYIIFTATYRLIQ